MMLYSFWVAALVCGFATAQYSLPCNDNFKSSMMSRIRGLSADISSLRTCTGTHANLAKNKKTKMSSQWQDGDGNRAVDGNWNPIWDGNSCTHTNNEANPFWQVDLGRNYDVTEVWIQNRADCCSGRLNKVYVYVGQREKHMIRCGEHIPAVGAGQVVTFKCDQPIYGRYVKVQLQTVSMLTLCEVAVFGH